MGMQTIRKSAYFEKIILNMIQASGHISRSEIYQQTGIRPSTISALTKNLIDEGSILEAGSLQAGKVDLGKKDLLVNAGYRTIIGIDVNVDQITGVLTDFCGSILHQASLPIQRTMSRDEILACLRQILREMREAAGGRELLGVGIATTGIVDQKGQRVLLSSQLPHWRDVALAELLEDDCPCPLFVEDRVAARLYAEKWLGSLPEHHTAVYIEMGAVFGASIMIDRWILKNPNGTMGEMGHFIVSSGNDFCVCGNVGCLQTVVTPDLIVKRVREVLHNSVINSPLLREGKALEALTVADVLHAADQGDRIACSVLSDAASYVGKAGSYIVNLLGPDLLILGGSLTDGTNFFTKAVTETISRYSLPMIADNLRFYQSTFAQTGGAVGAAAIVLDHFYQPQPLMAPFFPGEF